jgi:hypothetical protein
MARCARRMVFISLGGAVVWFEGPPQRFGSSCQRATLLSDRKKVAVHSVARESVMSKLTSLPRLKIAFRVHLFRLIPVEL